MFCFYKNSPNKKRLFDGIQELKLLSSIILKIVAPIWWNLHAVVVTNGIYYVSRLNLIDFINRVVYVWPILTGLIWTKIVKVCVIVLQSQRSIELLPQGHRLLGSPLTLILH